MSETVTLIPRADLDYAVHNALRGTLDYRSCCGIQPVPLVVGERVYLTRLHAWSCAVLARLRQEVDELSRRFEVELTLAEPPPPAPSATEARTPEQVKLAQVESAVGVVLLRLAGGRLDSEYEPRLVQLGPSVLYDVMVVSARSRFRGALEQELNPLGLRLGEPIPDLEEEPF